jgi:uncharacterized low-complexity protein
MINKKTPLAIAVGTTLLGGLVSNVNAEIMINLDLESNPFSLNELGSGYMQLAKANSKESAVKMKDGACGEGQCGASMLPKGALEKTVEGKCAGNKPMLKINKDMKKGIEGKCGEGKCGSNMS